MTGYVRKDTTNNIADGNVINAADLDSEFDGVQDAFNASTGHKHDGTAGEGATINALGPTQDVTVSATLLAPKTTNTVDIGSSALKFKDLFLAGNASVGGTLAVTGVATFTAQPVLSALTASTALALDASKNIVSVTNTGSGSNVLATSPTLVTPVLGVATGTSFQGIIGNVTPAAGSFTTLGASSTATLNTLASSGATLTGGTINGMTIGATTASSGAFTTLTTSSTVTHNGGTANGVTYLNGSKVLTSGSALTFDGTTLGAGAISATDTISTSKNTNASFVSFLATNANAGASTEAQFKASNGTNDGVFGIMGTGASTYGARLAGDTFIYSSINTASKGITIMADTAGGVIKFAAGGSTEGMRLTSTGLGIGTSSPAYKLDVTGGLITANLRYNTVGTGNTALLRFSVNNNYDGQSLAAIGALSENLNTTATSLVMQTEAAGGAGLVERARISSDGTFRVKGAGTAGSTDAVQFSGTAPASSLALDASGNLGLGVTPSAWGGGFKAFETTGTSLGSNAAGSSYYLQNSYYNGTNFIYTTTAAASYYQQVTGAHRWYNAPSGTAGNPITFTQAMTLDASGNLLVGLTTAIFNTSGRGTFNVNGTTDAVISLSAGGSTSTASYLLYDGTNTTLQTVSNGYMRFGTNNTERARIDSSGNLLVGTTTTSPGSGNTTTGNYLGAIGVASFSRASDASLTINTNTDSKVCRIYRSGSEVGDITVTTTTTSFNSTSDYRLKTVVGAVTGHGARIDALEPIEYTWNSTGLRTRGFLAHKFQEVYANSVTGTKDAMNADGKPEYQSMQASTSEVIADLVAEIQSLRQRLSAANL
jgi:hypothetical protein